MGYFIIMRGALGVGKTTISKRLADILNGMYVSIDKVLEDNKLNIIDENENGITVKNFIKGNEIVLSDIKESLCRNKHVIIDGCFYHKEQIDHFIDNLPFKHFVFTLKASLDTCVKRDAGREKVYGEGATTAVFNMVSKFDSGIIIETENKTAEQTIKEIMQYLNR